MKTNPLKTNRPFGLLLKGIGVLLSFFYRLNLVLQAEHLGPGGRVMGPTLISGGRNISIGANCRIGRNVVLDAAQGKIVIGDNVTLRDGCRIYAKNIQIASDVTVGEGVFLVGVVRLEPGVWVSRGCDLSGVTIETGAILGPHVCCIPGDHGRDAGGNISLSADWVWESIMIRKGSWVGSRAVLLKGVEIGTRAVVGAGSVVTHSVIPGAVVAGVPARPIQSSLKL